MTKILLCTENVYKWHNDMLWYIEY